MTYHDEDADDEFDDDDDDTPGRRTVDDREMPDAADMDDPDDPDDDAAETVACPWCRRPVYEGAERCPSCGRYLSEEDAPRHYAWWLIAGVVLCLLVILLFWMRRVPPD
jgi:hypothetical protein